jgi:hypothetical protein
MIRKMSRLFIGSGVQDSRSILFKAVSTLKLQLIYLLFLFVIIPQENWWYLFERSFRTQLKY